MKPALALIGAFTLGWAASILVATVLIRHAGGGPAGGTARRRGRSLAESTVTP